MSLIVCKEVEYARKCLVVLQNRAKQVVIKKKSIAGGLSCFEWVHLPYKKFHQSDLRLDEKLNDSSSRLVIFWRRFHYNYELILVQTTTRKNSLIGNKCHMILLRDISKNDVSIFEEDFSLHESLPKPLHSARGRNKRDIPQSSDIVPLKLRKTHRVRCAGNSQSAGLEKVIPMTGDLTNPRRNVIGNSRCSTSRTSVGGVAAFLLFLTGTFSEESEYTAIEVTGSAGRF